MEFTPAQNAAINLQTIVRQMLLDDKATKEKAASILVALEKGIDPEGGNQGATAKDIKAAIGDANLETVLSILAEVAK